MKQEDKIFDTRCPNLLIFDSGDGYVPVCMSIKRIPGFKGAFPCVLLFTDKCRILEGTVIDKSLAPNNT